MGYFLGYNNGIDLIPIYFTNKNSNDLLDIVNYTCEFCSIDELKNELFYNSLIPNYDVELCYLIEKGKKDNRTYKFVPGLNQIFLARDRIVFNVNYIRNFLSKNMNNKEFYIILYTSYLKKLGVMKEIERELTLLSSDDFKKFLTKILDYLSEHPLNINITNIIRDVETRSTVCNVHQVMELMEKNSEFFCLVFNYLKNHINIPQIQEIEYLKKIIFLQKNSLKNEYSIRELINKYINSALFLRSTNGSKERTKICTRNVVELGSIIRNYIDYCVEKDWRLNSRDIKVNQDDDDFLVEEDFERIGMVSTDYGYYLRENLK